MYKNKVNDINNYIEDSKGYLMNENYLFAKQTLIPRSLLRDRSFNVQIYEKKHDTIMLTKRMKIVEKK